jgi:2-methylcitrate dehydratase PrpD
MGATEKIARFIVNTGYEDIPGDAVEKAKRTALDCLGATLAGVVEPVSQTITGYIAKLGGPPQASVIGAGLKVSAPDAALTNGAIAHALDYDDCGVKIGHPSVLVLPALLSLGEQLGASGQDTLTAYIVGLEVEGKLALHGRLQAHAEPPEPPELVWFRRGGCCLRQAPPAGSRQDQNGIGHRRQLCLWPVG